jgi:hypothetical protein
LHPLFNIQPAEINPQETSLFAEVSNEGLSYFFLDDRSRLVKGLSVYLLNKKDPEHNICGLLKKVFSSEALLVHNYNDVFISYSFNESILIPEGYYNQNENAENMNLVYGDINNGIIMTDDVEEKNIFNVYRIPSDIHEEVNIQFPMAKFSHQYTYLLKQLPFADNLLKIIFYQTKVIITLLKNNELQLIQTFNYVTAEDVVFHMLNVCNKFNTEQTIIELGGTIERDSNLFNLVHKYFSTIGFSDLPHKLSYTENIKRFPPHYFSHLFANALCV